ncbi:hypothetical protein BV22DRAFT_988719, partial [Leucogyrophana mollusca]
ARSEASHKHKYESQKIREELTRLFKDKCGGKTPYQWQLDVSEALLLGVDSVVIAGTGAGKTMP